MFYGSHTVTMDAKGRVAIPARVRDQLQDYCGGEIVLTASTEDRCLLLYPKTDWDELAPQLQKINSRRSKAARRTRLLMLGYAQPVEVDGNGRMLVPTTHRKYADLDKKLLIIGQGNHFEVWCEEKFQAWVDIDDADDGVHDDLSDIQF